MIKKNGIFIITLMLILTLSGCAEQKSDGKSLYEHGMDVVALMEEMVNSSDYGNLVGNAEPIEELRLEIAAGDYTAPQAVYEVDFPAMGDVLALGDITILDGFSDSLKKQLDNRSASAFVNLINSWNGVAALATASVYTAGKTFVSSETDENVFYVYTFQNGYPIAVVFTVGEDGAVSATGTFLMLEGFDAESAELLQSMLNRAGFSGGVRLLPETP